MATTTTTPTPPIIIAPPPTASETGPLPVLDVHFHFWDLQQYGQHYRWINEIKDGKFEPFMVNHWPLLTAYSHRFQAIATEIIVLVRAVLTGYQRL